MQRLATGLDHNWLQLDCSCQLQSIVISSVASCPVCQKSKRLVVDRLQPVLLRSGHLVHDPPIQGHIAYFSHIFIYLFEFTRVLSIMVTPKMTYNAKSIISWAPVDQILWFWVNRRPGASSIFHIYISKRGFHTQLSCGPVFYKTGCNWLQLM